MDIEKIFPLLFFIVIIIFQIFISVIKKIGRDASDQPEKKEGGKGILQLIVNQIKEQIEQAQYPQSPPADGPKTQLVPGWENLMPQQPQADMSSKAYGKANEEDDESRYAAENTRNYNRPQATPSYSVTVDSDQDIGDIEEMAEILRAEKSADIAARAGIGRGKKSRPTAPTIPSVKKRHTARDLRQAIIWSEVLARPVALREE